MASTRNGDQSFLGDSVASKGKFRILGMDKSSDEYWVEGESGSKQNALSIAAKLTRDAMLNSISIDDMKVYHVYDDEGNYIGGDPLQDVELDGYGFDENTKIELAKLNQEKVELDENLEGIVYVTDENARYFAILDSDSNAKVEVTERIYELYKRREEVEEKSRTLLIRYCGKKIS